MRKAAVLLLLGWVNMFTKSLIVCLTALAIVGVAPRHHDTGRTKLDQQLLTVVQHRQPGVVRVLVRVQNGAAGRVARQLAAFGATTKDSTTPDLLVAADVTATALDALSRNPDVLHLSSDARLASLDTKLLSQNMLLATEGLLATRPDGQTVRSISYTGKNVGVALIDSGLTPNGDLNDVTFYDFTQNGKKVAPYDDYGHGTHVSGLMGSGGGMSNSQYAGLAPDCKYVVLKVLDQTGNGYTSDVIAAINFAVANKSQLHIDVINLSLGHPIYEPAATDPLVQAVERATAAGIVVVVSAGNFGGDPTTHEPEYAGVTSPGNAPDVITVGAAETFQTATRNDDVVAWYSSRGPTWYDGFQKPDVLAPGSHLVSDASPKSTLYATYPGGLVKVGDKPFIRLSGTSMSAGVVSGIVATMLQASRTNHPGALLTPNAVKAILEYTSLPLPSADPLSQGAGAINAAGAIALAAAIDPSAPIGSPWLSAPVDPWTTIDRAPVAWGQRVVWGDRVIWGNQILSNDPAFALRVVWGNQVVWGDRVIWGSSTVWDPGSQVTWANRVVWGNNLLGMTSGSRVVWGNSVPWGEVPSDRTAWGSLQDLNIAPTSMSWGNLERANDDAR